MRLKEIIFAYSLVVLFLFIFSIVQCRATGHLSKEKNPIDENNFRNSMEQMHRHQLWANANNPIKEEITESDFEYYEDSRVGLCYVIFRNRDIEKVPCGHLGSVL